MHFVKSKWNLYTCWKLRVWITCFNEVNGGKKNVKYIYCLVNRTTFTMHIWISHMFVKFSLNLHILMYNLFVLTTDETDNMNIYSSTIWNAVVNSCAWKYEALMQRKRENTHTEKKASIKVIVPRSRAIFQPTYAHPKCLMIISKIAKYRHKIRRKWQRKSGAIREHYIAQDEWREGGVEGRDA